MVEPDPDYWIVDRSEGKVTLMPRNSFGSYTLHDPKKVLKAAKALGPDEIDSVLTGAPPPRPGEPRPTKYHLCTCATGVGKQRCYHKFTFNDVREFRSARFTMADFTSVEVQRLKTLQPSRPGNPDNPDNPGTARTIKYFLKNVDVCPTYYKACLGLSKKKGDAISNLVRGIIPMSPRTCVPYNPDTKKFNKCVSFWLSFFGEQAQTSGPGHRYFPVNMSYFYIYMHDFWPWWKDNMAHWAVLPPRPPGADRALVTATSRPVDAQLSSSKEIQNLFLQLCREDHKVDNNENQHGQGGRAGQSRRSGQSDEGQPSGWLDEPDYTEEANLAVIALKRETDFPSFTTFLRARRDPQFNDVKPRDKHFHCRCPTHASLMAKIEQAKRDPKAKAEYDMQMRVHHQECKFWRTLEDKLQQQAKSNPYLGTVISYDDTSAMGFPRMTNQPVKNFPNDRVFMVPLNLTNHGTHENVYFYDFKNKWIHGADRMCTILYHVLHRIKHKPDQDSSEQERLQKRSNKLYLMGDNAPLNKNNTVLAFVSELVMKGWYEEVEMLFGPVGHTHNGNDAVHAVHNRICGAHDSITPAELFRNYQYTWRTDDTRPQPVIVECQYAWTDRYRPYINKVSGFTCTGENRGYVRAFRFSCVPGEGRTCQMEIKGCPSDPQWYGVNSVPGARGFLMLRGMPPGFPTPKQCTGYKIPRDYLKRICGKVFRTYCAERGKEMMFENLVRMATNLEVPSRGEVDEADWDVPSLTRRQAMKGYGPVELIGEPDSTFYHVPFVRARPGMTETGFWGIPEGAWSGRACLYEPTPPPICRYTHDIEQDRRQKKRGRSSESDDEDKKEDPQSPTPDTWGVRMSDLRVGKFAVVQSIFDADSDEENEEDAFKTGISVTEIVSLEVNGDFDYVGIDWRAQISSSKRTCIEKTWFPPPKQSVPGGVRLESTIILFDVPKRKKKEFTLPRIVQEKLIRHASYLF